MENIDQTKIVISPDELAALVDMVAEKVIAIISSQQANTPKLEASNGYLSRKEVADMFGVTPKTVRRWERANIIKPAYYQRGHPKYKYSDVEKAVTPKQEIFYCKKAANEKS